MAPQKHTHNPNEAYRRAEMSSTDFKGADKKLSDIESKYRDVDPDLRFMALSDLNKLLVEHSLIFNKVNSYSRTIYAILLEALVDTNQDVQNQALRCFEPLVGALDDEEILIIITKLNASQTGVVSITASIQTMAIAEILKNINLKHASTGTKIIGSLLPSLISAEGNIQTLDSIEILTNVIQYLGNTISPAQLGIIYTGLVKTIFEGESIIGKKSIAALGYLLPNFSHEQFQQLLSLLSNQQSDSYETVTLTLLTYITLAKSDTSRFAESFDGLFQYSTKHLYLEDDELDDEQTKIDNVRYEALNLIDTLLTIGEPASGCINQVFDIIKKFLVYDPYNNVMDEDDEDDFSEPDFSDDEYDDVDDSNDDNTWRLRKQASKLGATLVEVFPNTLLKIYTSGVFESVLKMISDSSDAVSFENIKTLDVFVQASLRLNGQRSSRKRKGSDVVMGDTEDPVSYLSKYRSEIVNKFIKEMNGAKGNTLNTYSELLNFFQKFNNLDENLKPLLACIREHNFGLNMDLLKLYSALLRNNDLNFFGDEFPHIIQNINNGLTSKNHISITNSLSTSIDILDLTYNDTLTDSIIAIASSSKNDSGIRNTAIEGLGQVKTLPDAKIAEILFLLSETLKYEPIVVSTIEAITQYSQTYGTRINVPALGGIIAAYRDLLPNAKYSSDVIDSLVSVSAVVAVDSSVGDLLLKWFNEGSNTAQILRILSHLDIEKSKLIDVFLKASSKDEVDDSALLDVSRKIGSELIPILEQNSESDRNIKILANIVVHEGLTSYVLQREQELMNGTHISFNLKFLGYVGESTDVSITVDQLMKFFNDDEVKIYAADTIGKIISRNSTAYLKVFLEKIKADDNRYLLLVAIKQVLRKDTSLQHESFNEIWDTLIGITKTLPEIDDNLNRIISHDLGLILVNNNDTNFFYTKASDLLDSESKVVVYTIIASIKFILAYDDIVSMELIESLLIRTFNKITAAELEVKQVAMITLMTALNNQFTALSGYLPEVLPQIYEELQVRKEYQETIQIGPFKHKIDKALEVRKNAFELLYKLTLNHAVLKNVDFNEVLSVVVQHGLKADIVSISSLIIMKLLEFDEVVLNDNNKEILKTGIDKLLVAIKKKEEQSKDSKEEQETKNTLLSLRNAVFPVA